MSKLPDVVLETEKHYVVRVAKGLEVYENGVTAAKRVAFIGYEGQKGFDRARLEIERREGRRLLIS